MDTANTYQNIEELAADLDFIHWVKSGQTQPQGLWYENLKTQGSQAWIDPARELIDAVHFKRTEIDQATIERVWDAIDRQTSEVQKSQGKIRALSAARWRIAAGLAMLIAFAAWWTFSPNGVTIETEYAQTTSIDLPDGSAVNLNASSTLRYDEEKWDSERKVELEGEAFFNVVKGQKFSIETSTGTVEVLGTSFNVYSRDHRLDVACHTGKVRVIHNNQKVILQRGDRVTLKNGLLVTSVFQVDPQKTWMSGYFLFENAQLDKVVQEIERQFGVTVTLENVKRTRRYSGFFVKNDLTEALQAVCWPLRLNFEVNGTEVTISQDNK